MLNKVMHFKSYEEHREHFIFRLQERYGINLSEAEYDLICDDIKSEQYTFNGIFKKGTTKTVGYIFIESIKIWCLYNPKLNCFSTCYPPDTDTDIRQLMKACFPRSIMRIVNIIYQHYLDETEDIKIDFNDDKEAAIYYFENTLFPNLHIEKYKCKYKGKEGNNVGIVQQIRKIINGKTPLKITLVKK